MMGAAWQPASLEIIRESIQGYSVFAKVIIQVLLLSPAPELYVLVSRMSHVK
jgi:hypothetical protein